MDGALVVAGRDGPVLLQFGEEVLDQVAGLVEVLVVRAQLLAVRLGRDHGRLACLRERLEHSLLGIVGLVGDQRGSGEVGQQSIGTFEVVRLPRREGEPGRVAERVDQGVDLRAQAAAAAPVKGKITVYRWGSPIVYRLADRRGWAGHSGAA